VSKRSVPRASLVRVGASPREGPLHPSVVSIAGVRRDRRWQAQLAQQSEIFGDFNRQDERSRPYFAFRVDRNPCYYACR